MTPTKTLGPPSYILNVPSLNGVFNLIFLIKLFLYMTKNPRQKYDYFKNEKSFYGEIKHIFIIFIGLSVAKVCLRPEIVPYFRDSYHLMYKTSILFVSNVEICHHSFALQKSSGRVCLIILKNDILYQMNNFFEQFLIISFLRCLSLILYKRIMMRKSQLMKNSYNFISIYH